MAPVVDPAADGGGTGGGCCTVPVGAGVVHQSGLG